MSIIRCLYGYEGTAHVSLTCHLTIDASRKWVLMSTASRVSSPSSLRTDSDRVKGRILVPVPVGSSAASPCTHRERETQTESVFREQRSAPQGQCARYGITMRGLEAETYVRD
jgi:hypothetical protein